MIVFGGHKTVPTLLCGLRGHIPVPTKSVNVGMPAIWQPNTTDTGKRQNTAVRITYGGVGFVGEKLDHHRAEACLYISNTLY